MALDIAGNMQTIDDKWASSTPTAIAASLAAGSALTVARSDHAHNVASGTVGSPGLPIGESNSGFYRIGSANIGATIAGALSWAFSATGIAIETALALKHVASVSALSGYVKIFAKSNEKLYKETGAGDEVEILDADIFTAQGDLVYGTGAEAYTQLAKGTARQALLMNSGATAPEWAASPQSLMTAQGDILHASAANTPARLAIGVAGQHLTVNSGATAPEWAYGFQKIAEVTGTGASGVMEFSSIPNTYRSLMVIVYGRTDAAVAAASMRATFETSPTAGSYFYQQLRANNTTVTGAENPGTSDFIHIGAAVGTSGDANSSGFSQFTLPNYSGTSLYKGIIVQASSFTSLASGGLFVDFFAGLFKSTSAIDRVRLLVSTGNWTTTSKATLYGIPA